MKELWYLVLMLLMLGVLAAFSNMTTPTSAFVANLPPQWDFSSTDFTVDGKLDLNLGSAFFDPDGDPLSFSVSPGPGVSAGLYDDVLVAYVEQNSYITITASDGKSLVSQRITVNLR